MADMQMTGDLVRVWITVTDADGSTRLESRWTSSQQAIAPHAAA